MNENSDNKEKLPSETDGDKNASETFPETSGQEHKSGIVFEIILIAVLVSIGLYCLLVIYPALTGGPVSSLYPSFLYPYLPAETAEAMEAAASSEKTPEHTKAVTKPASKTPSPTPAKTPSPTPTKTPTPTPTKTPIVTASPTPTPIPMPTLAPEIEDIRLSSYADADADDWNLILVNKTHPIPDDYTYELEFYDPDDQSHQVDTRIADPLREMMADCEEAGNSPILCSAWRDDGTQSVLYDQSDYLAAHPDEEITSVALPGTSEHEIGIAVDIYSAENTSLDDSQEQTKTQQWLMKHCWEYGFILRYPKGKEEITEIIYEPWHYRYVGPDAAKDITESGLCLEEYLENMDKVKAADLELKKEFEDLDELLASIGEMLTEPAETNTTSVRTEAAHTSVKTASGN